MGSSGQWDQGSGGLQCLMTQHHQGPGMRPVGHPLGDRHGRLPGVGVRTSAVRVSWPQEGPWQQLPPLVPPVSCLTPHCCP